ncbi:MAG: hypothetical protein ACYTGB_20170 [Planctomycetota bacterium]|jgi:hypothetical protein
MDDKLVDRMKADRGLLAKIMEKVPGFRGYLENTTIWEADKMIREEIARRLTATKESVNLAVRAAGKDVRAGELLSELERLLTGLDGATNKVRFADYGHSAISSKIKVRADDLARLLAADRAMFERLQEIEAAGGELAEKGPGAMQAALGSFEGQFGARKDAMIAAAESGEKEG